MDKIKHPGILKRKADIENLQQQIFLMIDSLPYSEENKFYIRMAYDGTIEKLTFKSLGLEFEEYLIEPEIYFFENGISYVDYIKKYNEIYDVYSNEVNKISKFEAERLYENKIFSEEEDFVAIYDIYESILNTGVTLNESQLILSRFLLKHYVNTGLLTKEKLKLSIHEHSEALVDLTSIPETNEEINLLIRHTESRKAYLEILFENYPSQNQTLDSFIEMCDKENITGNRIQVRLSTRYQSNDDAVRAAGDLIYSHFKQLLTLKYKNEAHTILNQGKDFEQFLCQTFEYFPYPETSTTTINSKIPKSHLLKLFRDLYESNKTNTNPHDAHRWVEVIMKVLPNNITGKGKTNLNKFSEVASLPPSNYIFFKP